MLGDSYPDQGLISMLREGCVPIYRPEKIV